MSEKIVHNIKISVFVKQNENEKQIEKVLKKFVGIKNFEDNNKNKEKLKIKKSSAKGVNDESLTILELEIKKQNLVRKFLESLISNLTKKQKVTLLKQTESRLDEELAFYLRFDKNELLKDKFVLTDKGKCFHIRMLVAAFPKKREIALKIVENLLNK